MPKSGHKMRKTRDQARVRSGTEMAPDLVPKWAQIPAPKWRQNWDQNGAGFGSKGAQILGPNWSQIWGRVGSRFGTKRGDIPGTKMPPGLVACWRQIRGQGGARSETRMAPDPAPRRCQVWNPNGARPGPNWRRVSETFEPLTWRHTDSGPASILVPALEHFGPGSEDNAKNRKRETAELRARYL